ncbi:Hpt domain-containing protein [Zafaria sp. Z1313]|uniref:Hpt domain-containing protein n=1 Tax=Zafaria sp. Z1313 TaxID=3423202 RepID=UPI003D303BA2
MEDLEAPRAAPWERKLVECPLLVSLVDELGLEPVIRCIDSFTRMWGGRCERLERAVVERDADAGMDAALSLKSGAAMLGALPLASLAQEMHAAARAAGCTGLWTPAERLLTTLQGLGSATAVELDAIATREGGDYRGSAAR